MISRAKVFALNQEVRQCWSRATEQEKTLHPDCNHSSGCASHAEQQLYITYNGESQLRKFCWGVCSEFQRLEQIVAAELSGALHVTC